mmetsp:Transcript_77194/g.160669  ORF Transcript_77194/g.160669 Transcript_77194/m.160669 type:complete len:121 (+) Transcript_77194:752-1114(+)
MRQLEKPPLKALKPQKQVRSKLMFDLLPNFLRTASGDFHRWQKSKETAREASRRSAGGRPEVACRAKLIGRDERFVSSSQFQANLQTSQTLIGLEVVNVFLKCCKSLPLPSCAQDLLRLH